MGAKMASAKKGFWMQIIKGSLMAVSISLIGILIFAFVIKFTSISDNIITPINQVIKVLSLLIGCFTVLRKQGKNGLIKGAIVGLIYSILAYFIFAVLSKNFTFNLTVFNDIAFSSAIGAICGMLAVNLSKKG